MNHKIIVSVIILFAIALPVGLSAQSTGDSEGLFWSIDPLGFLTVGPSFELGGYFAENHQIAGRFRLTALGLLPQIIAKGDSLYPGDKWMMPWSFGVDVVYTGRYMLSGNFGLYYGGSMGIQYSDNRDYWYDDYEPYYRKWISWHVPVMVIFGAEISSRKNPKMYYRFGITAGIAIGIDETYYKPVSGDVEVYDDPVESYFIGALQAIIGWRF